MSIRFVPTLVAPHHQPSMPFVHGHLHIGLAWADDPDCTPIRPPDMRHLTRPFVDTCHRAVWSLRGRTTSEDLEPVDTCHGLWAVRSRDGLAASRMMCIQDLIRPWPLEGVVVTCPDPDQLLIVPLEGLGALSAVQGLLRAARLACTDPQGPLSDQLFWCDDQGRWRHVPVSHDGGRVDLGEQPAFYAALERLTAVELVLVAAEA